jgi:hypothetical protein
MPQKSRKEAARGEMDLEAFVLGVSAALPGLALVSTL